MKLIHHILAFFLTVLGSVACFIFFQIFYKYHLVHRLDLQLFLYTKEYLFSYFQQPAWLASLLGDFLSQFFYFNVGGALTLTLTILTLGILFYLALGKILIISSTGKGGWKNFRFWVKVILSLCLMIWEVLRNCGVEYKLSSTIALVGGTLLFLLYTNTPLRIRGLSGLILLCMAYWMFGYGIWILLLLMIGYELCLRKYLLVPLFVIFSIVIPLTLRQSYFLTMSQAFQYPAVTFSGKPDFAIEKLLAMDVLSSNGQWAAVARLSEKNNSKSGLASYFYNLSHGMEGTLAFKLMERSYTGANGLLIPLNPKMSPLAMWSSNEAWFQLGDMTMAEHSTLLGMIFSPDHRSIRMIKRLAEINMVNGDTVAVQKYIGMLQKTWLYKSWGDQRVPGKESAGVKAWLKRKQELVAKVDTLRDAVNPALSLRILLDSNKENKLALDYLLCYDLLTKNIPDFMLDYEKYKLPGHIVPERLYAEGLLVGLAQRSATEKEMKRYKIYPDVLAEFSNYTKLYEKGYLGNDYLRSQFGKTYWFYYHFAKFK